MLDFHIDDLRTAQEVRSLDEVRQDVLQVTAERVKSAHDLWLKLSSRLTPSERTTREEMRPYMEMAQQEYHLPGVAGVKFAFAHELVRQICRSYLTANPALFDSSNAVTQDTLYGWIIDDDTVRTHLLNSGKSATDREIQIARPELIRAAVAVPQRIGRRRGQGYQ